MAKQGAWAKEIAEAKRTGKPVPIGGGYQIHSSGIVTQIPDFTDGKGRVQQ